MGHTVDLVQLDPRVAQVQGFCKGSKPLFASLTPFGGAEEIRTPDPLRAKEVLSQLSYGPAPYQRRKRESNLCCLQASDCQPSKVVGHSGFEPETCRLRRPLYQPSYGPNLSTEDSNIGGPWWTRTTDLSLIRTAL
jgi:hypothetical protein